MGFNLSYKEENQLIEYRIEQMRNKIPVRCELIVEQTGMESDIR